AANNFINLLRPRFVQRITVPSGVRLELYAVYSHKTTFGRSHSRGSIVNTRRIRPFEGLPCLLRRLGRLLSGIGAAPSRKGPSRDQFAVLKPSSNRSGSPG